MHKKTPFKIGQRIRPKGTNLIGYKIKRMEIQIDGTYRCLCSHDVLNDAYYWDYQLEQI